MTDIKQFLHYDPNTGIFTWAAEPAGRKKGRIRKGAEAGRVNKVNGYRYICFEGRTYLAHRLAWFFMHGAFPSKQIDHINGMKLDNRIVNLRDVEPRVNSENMYDKPLTKTPYIGAHRQKGATTWYSKIVVKGKLIYLGTYSTPEAAHQAYLTAKRQLHEGCTI